MCILPDLFVDNMYNRWLRRLILPQSRFSADNICIICFRRVAARVRNILYQRVAHFRYSARIMSVLAVTMLLQWELVLLWTQKCREVSCQNNFFIRPHLHPSQRSSHAIGSNRLTFFMPLQCWVGDRSPTDRYDHIHANACTHVSAQTGRRLHPRPHGHSALPACQPRCVARLGCAPVQHDGGDCACGSAIHSRSQHRAGFWIQL